MGEGVGVIVVEINNLRRGSKMIKVIFGLLFMLLGAYGMFWWHEALLNSGVDSNRNIIQYYIPYILLGLV